MGEMENLAEFYYEKLKTSSNPAQVLLEFYRKLINEDAGRSEIIMINKLIRLFDRYNVYFSIMELTKFNANDLKGNLYPLVYTICKSRFEKIHNGVINSSQEPLNKMLRELEKEREKAQKSRGKIPTSEGL